MKTVFCNEVLQFGGYCLLSLLISGLAYRDKIIYFLLMLKCAICFEVWKKWERQLGKFVMLSYSENWNFFPLLWFKINIMVFLLNIQWRKLRNWTRDNYVLSRGRVTPCGVKQNTTTPQGWRWLSLEEHNLKREETIIIN